jgi:hypothetical protein
MAVTSDEAYRSCAAAALELYRSADGHIAVQIERTVKFQATFPLAMYALNQIYASLELVKLGRPFLATANVRVAYEHAVTAQWVLFSEGAEDRLVGSINREMRKRVRMLESYAAIPDELRTGYGQDTDPLMPNFRDRCRALDGGNDSLYWYYGALTEAVHPSVATLVQHLTFNDEPVIAGVKFGAVHDPPPDMWAACAVSALAAAYTIEVQSQDQTRLNQVFELVNQYAVPCNLSLRDKTEPS